MIYIQNRFENIGNVVDIFNKNYTFIFLNKINKNIILEIFLKYKILKYNVDIKTTMNRGKLKEGYKSLCLFSTVINIYKNKDDIKI